MTEEQKLERCISLIWSFGEIYDGDDIEQFQSAELSMYSEYDELVKYLEDLKAKAEATKELQEELIQIRSKTMPDMNENAETQQEYFGKAKLETDYKDLSMRLYKRNTELEKQIKKMQNCRNCKKEKIEGACGHFTQVGWCKNWELAE